jgi:hypothetical protein
MGAEKLSGRRGPAHEAGGDDWITRSVFGGIAKIIDIIKWVGIHYDYPFFAALEAISVLAKSENMAYRP